MEPAKRIHPVFYKPGKAVKIVGAVVNNFLHDSILGAGLKSSSRRAEKPSLTAGRVMSGNISGHAEPLASRLTAVISADHSRHIQKKLEKYRLIKTEKVINL